MKRTPALFSACFCAGLIGAIASTAVAWACSHYGLTGLAGVQLKTRFALSTLYPAMIWGGLWGLVYGLSVAGSRSRRQWVRKGMIISILPTLYQLLVVFPYQSSYGNLGINLGLLTPLFIFIYNFVWGITTGIFARLFWGKG